MICVDSDDVASYSDCSSAHCGQTRKCFPYEDPVKGFSPPVSIYSSRLCPAKETLSPKMAYSLRRREKEFHKFFRDIPEDEILLRGEWELAKGTGSAPCCRTSSPGVVLCYLLSALHGARSASSLLATDYSCAYSKDMMLCHGRLYMSANWFCFHVNMLGPKHQVSGLRQDRKGM